MSPIRSFETDTRGRRLGAFSFVELFRSAKLLINYKLDFISVDMF